MRPKRPARNKGSRVEESPNPVSNLPPKAVLDSLPEHVRVAVVEAASSSGPLPPPAMYSEYERALPGSAERILAMAEKEQDHRIKWEGIALNTSAREAKLGQWLGFAIAVACIGAAIFLAVSGHDVVAGIIALGAGAVGLVGRFLGK